MTLPRSRGTTRCWRWPGLPRPHRCRRRRLVATWGNRRLQKCARSRIASSILPAPSHIPSTWVAGAKALAFGLLAIPIDEIQARLIRTLVSDRSAPPRPRRARARGAHRTSARPSPLSSGQGKSRLRRRLRQSSGGCGRGRYFSGFYGFCVLKKREKT